MKTTEKKTTAKKGLSKPENGRKTVKPKAKKTYWDLMMEFSKRPAIKVYNEKEVYGI